MTAPPTPTSTSTPPPSSPAPTIAVVVVSYRSHHLLQRHLVPLTHEVGDALVVVVDNHSTPQEAARVGELSAANGWTFLASPVNLGFGAAANAGVESAAALGAEVVVLLNPDAVLGAAALRRLGEAVMADPMAMAAPVVMTPDGRIWSDGMDVDLETGATRATRKRDPGDEHRWLPWLSGACVALSLDLWRRVGGLDEGYFLYWEDVDLSRRVVNLGGRLTVLRDATAVHDEGGTQRDDRQPDRRLSPLYYYFNARNRLVFAGRHLDPVTQRRWVRGSARAGYAILRRGGRRQLLQPGPPVAALLRGTRDGYLELRRVRRRTRGDEPGGTVRPGALRVLQSFPDPRPTTNPYLVQLQRALTERGDLRVLTFTWRRALREPVDVVHLHWPEILVTGRTPARALARQLLFLAVLLRMQVTRTPLVRTVHNLELPDGIDRRATALLRLAERHTTWRIALNDATPSGGAPTSVIPHGHYRDWYGGYPPSAPIPGRIGFVGFIRRYKGVEGLVRAFREVRDPAASLEVSGRPSSAELAAAITGAAAGDSRIHLQLDFVDDAGLVGVVTRSQLVVLPYPQMHNSGATLAALSLGRPVLVPENEVNRALAAEVGPGWVLCYPGPLTARTLREAMAQVAGGGRGEAPDLCARDWTVAAREHAMVYRRAVARRIIAGSPQGNATQ